MGSLRSFLALSFLGTLFINVSPAQDIPKNPDVPPGIEVQTRGPVHEAFAQPVDVTPGPSAPVPKRPPDPIPELPPDFKPEGENVQWHAGYWAWDADLNDFTWVSGTYRNEPLGRRFVPGYWTQTEDGWRWVSGFWASENQQQLQYSPEPPATLENGPSLPGPEDCVYIPGHWSWRESRFYWRPGYYAPTRPGRIWVQAQFCWTPSGYLFNDGYWDYPLEDRGLLFAPVHFTQPLWTDPSWYYSPSYCVRPFSLLDALFYRPSFGHFFFGDYYGRNYLSLGFHPWWGGPSHYDPLFRHYRWNHRHDRDWYGGLRRDYDDRFAGRLAAPPRTLVQQTTIVNNNVNNTNINRQRVVAPLREANNQNNVRLVKVDRVQAAAQRERIERTRELAKERSRVEASQRPRPDSTRSREARTLKLPAVTGATSPKTGQTPVRKIDQSSPRKVDPTPSRSNPTQPPRKVETPPRVNPPPPPTPKRVEPPAPRKAETAPPPTPKRVEPPAPRKVETAPPRVNPAPPPAPRRVESPAPRKVESPPPRPSPPPRASAPPPRASSPPPPPRASSPPPRPAPRANPPPPPPRASAPPPQQQRPSPPPRQNNDRKKK